MHVDNPGIPTVPQYTPGTPVAAYIAGLVALVFVAAIVVLGPKLLTRRQESKPADAEPKPEASPATGSLTAKADEHDAMVRETFADLRERLDRAITAQATAERDVRRCEEQCRTRLEETERARTEAVMQLQEARWHLDQARGEVIALRAQLQTGQQNRWQ